MNDDKKITQRIIAGMRVELIKPKIELTADERALAKALSIIADTYGKFDENGSGIWAGYESPEENDESKIGVKCENCVLYMGGNECAIIALPVAPEGKCRFAVIPDGVVNWIGKKNEP